MTEVSKAVAIIEDLSKNAVLLKKKLMEGDISGSASLIGDRIALIEQLRILQEAKVSLANSERRDEMSNLMSKMRTDVSQAAELIRKRSASLLNELAGMRGARNIALYKTQGGQHGYQSY